MLKTLRIRNLAVIEDLRIDFEPGLNVLTGETGAGKSILLDALGLALGGRADRSTVRSDADRAVVEAQFDLAPGDPAARVLRDLALGEDDGVVVVRREVGASGSGRVLLNDSPCTVTALRRVFETWVDVLGQSEHHRLRDRDVHLALLDEFADAGEDRDRVAAAYREAREARAARDALLGTRGEVEARAERLRAVVGEIDAVAPREGERDELERDRRLLRHAGRVREAVERALGALRDDDEAAAGRLAAAERLLAGLADVDGSFEEQAGRLRAARLEIEDVALTLRDRTGSDDFDPARIDRVEHRLAAIERLALRFGPTETDILDQRDAAARELASLRDLDGEIERAGAALGEALARYREAAEALGARRRRAAEALRPEVEQGLAELAMPKARFDTELEPVAGESVGDGADATPISPSGAERAEFLMSANPGEPPRPLSRTASGGELSRVLLALHGALGARAGARVLVFDEVDAGIGGATADAVGRRLARLARGRQVLCVTHLPQVAAYADHHYSVTKRVEGGRTRAAVRALDGDDRVDELARMLGGRRVSDASRRNAEDLLRNARSGRTS